MKTTIDHVCSAYKALNKLIMRELPLRLGMSLYRLRESLKETYSFACLEERKAQEAFNVELMNGGNLHFDSPEKREKYLDRIQEVLNTEVDIAVSPVDISEMSGNILVNLGALDGFVKF